VDSTEDFSAVQFALSRKRFSCSDALPPAWDRDDHQWRIDALFRGQPSVSIAERLPEHSGSTHSADEITVDSRSRVHGW